jgi:hypothetical protein
LICAAAKENTRVAPLLFQVVASNFSEPDKLRLVQFLIGEIAREEDPGMFAPGAAYAIWSPYDSYEAAATLQAMLEQEQGVQHG